jgi:HEAT repeat protein
MAMTMSELRQRLSAIEPDEGIYEGIGNDELGLLQELLEDDEAWLAARAVYAMSRVGTPEAHDRLSRAARNPRPEVRVAVAANAGRLPAEKSDSILEPLLDDSDVGVRKFAIKSVSDRSGGRVRRRLSEIAAGDRDPALRGLAQKKAELLPPL